MAFAQGDFGHLLGLQGFSDVLLKNHFMLYQGYVANANRLADAIAVMIKEGKQSCPDFAELKRRFGWEFNGMRLHELYFGNISKTGKPLGNGALKKQIIADFGSFDAFEREIRAVCAMRGIGWAVLYHDSVSARLFCCWIDEHDKGHLSGCIPLLVLDLFEHAFIPDYGIRKQDYIESLWKVIDWKAADERFVSCRQKP